MWSPLTLEEVLPDPGYQAQPYLVRRALATVPNAARNPFPYALAWSLLAIRHKDARPTSQQPPFEVRIASAGKSVRAVQDNLDAMTPMMQEVIAGDFMLASIGLRKEAEDFKRGAVYNESHPMDFVRKARGWMEKRDSLECLTMIRPQYRKMLNKTDVAGKKILRELADPFDDWDSLGDQLGDAVVFDFDLYYLKRIAKILDAIDPDSF